MNGKQWGLVALLGASPVVLGVGGVLAATMAVVAVGGGATASAPTSIPGIPPVLLQAYGQAAAQTAKVAPQCTGMRWSILAGIAQIESDQAAGTTIAADGTITPPILGPRLDGSGAGGNTTPVYDTDHGQWDGDTVYDRAVGPFQFIPSSWQIYGADANGDGKADPNNAFDAALGAVKHLCGAGKRDLTDLAQLREAILGYNHSQTYVDEVTGWITRFDQMGAAAGSTTPVAGSGKGAAVVAAAQRWLGWPYSWGGGDASGPTYGQGTGANTKGFDCSGLTVYAYAQVGVQLPRVAAQQFMVGTRIPRSAGLGPLAPGDLLFFAANPATGAGVHHVAIYVGGGQMINAPHTGAAVRVEPVWMDQYAGAVRLP